MHTARSLTVSHCILCTPPATMHTPLSNHACPPQPCTPPYNHTHPPTTMHTPNHACPHNHACPPATMHAPLWQPHMPLLWQPHMPPTMHAPQPRMPPLWTEFLIHASDNKNFMNSFDTEKKVALMEMLQCWEEWHICSRNTCLVLTLVCSLSARRPWYPITPDYLIYICWR